MSLEKIQIFRKPITGMFIINECIKLLSLVSKNCQIIVILMKGQGVVIGTFFTGAEKILKKTWKYEVFFCPRFEF